MGITSTQLDIIDVTPKIGSQIKADLDTLLSGREAAEHPRDARAAAELSSSAGWTSATNNRSPSPKRSATSCKTREESGIYKISLDKNVKPKADYLKGSMFWHFDGSLQPYPNLATLLRAIKLSDAGDRPSSATPTRRTTICPNQTKNSSADLRVVPR